MRAQLSDVDDVAVCSSGRKTVLADTHEQRLLHYGMVINIWLFRTHQQRDPIDRGMTPLLFVQTRKDLTEATDVATFAHIMLWHIIL